MTYYCKGIGEEYYKACIAFHTSTNMTAQQIHDTGIKVNQVYTC